MAYVALYRKYRSQSFGEVIGQTHITTVLQNAIRSGRIAHAYLFTGPRGCGKTSTARLLARALNCQAQDGPTPEPCGVCDMCERIRAGSAMDVIEMDAASETGIDDVREKIIENAKYSTAEARFKVYIIDEVHDLSSKAFDSLLKTIEEPPAHVVFVLATTEAHKVPITIRSRCQRMDFRRGTVQDLLHNIERVLAAEGIESEPEAVAAIARAAEGSFRDSLSLLEQALAFSDGKVTAEAVHAAVGSVGPEVLDDLMSAISSDDLAAAFQRAAALTEAGRDVKQVLVALQAHLRDLMVAAISAKPQSLPEVSPERFGVLRKQAADFAPDRILRMLDVLAEAERDVRFTNQHRLLLERALWSVLPSQLAQRGAPVAAPASATTARAPAPRPTTSDPVAPVAQRPAPASTPREAPSPRQSPPAQPTPAVREPAPARAAVSGPVDLDCLRRIWSRVRSGIVDRSKAASAIFGSEFVAAFDGRVVTVAFPSQFHKDKADRPAGKELMRTVLEAELGVTGLAIRCTVADSETDDPPAGAAVQAPLDLAGGTADVKNPVAPPAPADPETAEDGRFFQEVLSEMNAKPVDD
jgi:DNA polymerase III subunit gamma/tau